MVSLAAGLPKSQLQILVKTRYNLRAAYLAIKYKVFYPVLLNTFHRALRIHSQAWSLAGRGGWGGDGAGKHLKGCPV